MTRSPADRARRNALHDFSPDAEMGGELGPTGDGASAVQIMGAIRNLAFALVGAAYEEAMRTHGLMPETIKIITANARANFDALDEAHREALIKRAGSISPD